MAPQDVVPVEAHTIPDWTHPPYSGHNDGRFVWGRGACDCKVVMNGQLLAIESLIEKGFVPRRTVLLAYGFDEEEVLAPQGAGELAKEIERQYGQNGIEFIVDEGNGIGDAFGAHFAAVATSEKGYLDGWFIYVSCARLSPVVIMPGLHQ
jgi:Gly-Xaa carboxypeptidase